MWWTGPAGGTDGIEPIGISQQALARGGADVAVGDSALSQVENPATLSLSPRDVYRFDAAGELLMQQAHWSNPINSSGSSFRHIPLGHIGLAIPASERLTLGVALHSKSQLGTRYKARPWLFPHPRRRLHADMRNAALSLNAGVQATEKLSLGLGLRGELATGEFDNAVGPMLLDFGRGYALGAGFQVGLHYRVLPTLAVGAAYRSPTFFQDVFGDRRRAWQASDAHVSLFGLRSISLGDGIVDDIQFPQRIAAGLAWDATSRLKLVSEVRWINYSDSMFGRARFSFDGPIPLSFTTPLGYRDQWVGMAGAEVKLDEHWTLGAGYHYGTNPISRSALLPIAANIVQHHVTAGLRYERGRWWVGGGYTMGFKNSLRSRWLTRLPLAVDYASCSIEQTQHSVTLGFGYRW